VDAGHPACALVPPPSGRRFETLGLALILLAATWLNFWWVGWPHGRWVTPQPGGYNAALADAFLAGQLHLKIAPAPELAHLADPYDPKQYGPYQVMDLSYYRGRYYSYFGIAPVVLLFLPWEAVTGTCLTEPFAAAFFTCASLALALTLLAAVRRRHFPGAPGGFVILAGLVLGFGSFSLMLLEPPYYPQVQMASAWFWQLAALFCVHRALQSPPRALGWTAGASLACGLSVASRPSYLLGALLLLPLLGHLSRTKSPSGGGPRRRMVAIAVAGVVPIALIGVALLGYNYARFGSPWELGMRYQQWGRDLRSQVFLSPANLWPHLRAYLAGSPPVVRYFPFLLHQAGPVGVTIFFPFYWLAVLAPLGGTNRSRPDRPGLAAFVLSCAIAFGGNLLLLALYYLAWARYQLDFQPQLAWLAVIGLLAAGHAWRARRQRVRLLAGAALLLAGVSVLTGFCFPSAAPYQPSAKTALLARLLDRPIGWWEHLRGVTFGPLRLEVEFPAGRAGHTEPLLTSGATLKDLLYVRYLDDTHLQFGFFHEGLGGPVTDPVDVARGARHILEIDWGARCPPAEHPVFAGWPAPAILRAKTALGVRLDGRELFAQDAMYHFATPGDVVIGREVKGFDFCAPVFTGSIRMLPGGALRPPPTRSSPSSGLILDVQFGPRRTGYAEPLVAVGRPQSFAVLSVQYLAGDQLRLAIDGTATGAFTGNTWTLPRDHAVHRLALWLPDDTVPASPSGPMPPREILAFCDDRLVLEHSSVPDPVEGGDTYLGVNPFGASTTEPMFAGRILAAHPAAAAFRSGRESRLPGCPLRLLVAFPVRGAGRSDPLLVTGRTGAGDLIYVHYLDHGRLQFGFDHWGVGGIVGPPVDVPPGGFHCVEVSIGSLYPPPTDASAPRDPRRLAVAVTLDGVAVLAGSSPCHPAAPPQIFVGENPIGGSTCGEKFTGAILLIERGPDTAPGKKWRPALEGRAHDTRS